MARFPSARIGCVGHSSAVSLTSPEWRNGRDCVFHATPCAVPVLSTVIRCLGPRPAVGYATRQGYYLPGNPIPSARLISRAQSTSATA